MPVYFNTALRVVANTTPVSSFAKEVSLNASAEAKDSTPIGGSGGWKRRLPGLKQFAVSAKGMQDFAVGGIDVAFPATTLGGSDVITCMPINDGSVVGEPAFLMNGREMGITPIMGKIGDIAGFEINWAGDGRLVGGKILHPSTRRTATGNGTAVAMVGPAASQALYASFHVTSVEGAGTITFNVQTDDGAGFASATTRITSAAFAAAGSELKSVAGAFAAETHVRVTWTISGLTAATFEVAAGVAA
jgi:hypothetical protein